MVDECSLNRARSDVEVAINIWRGLLGEFDNVELAYIKGSSIKAWDSPIDYVPVVSDIDLHIKTEKGKPLLPVNGEGFSRSLKINSLYQERFIEVNPNHLHIPRIQVVTMEELKPEWIPNNLADILALYGDINPGRVRTVSEVRSEDLLNLMGIETVLEGLPLRMIDRIGLEYYRILRQLCWRVSPAPYRLLSQELDPEEVWRLNRTRVTRKLDDEGYTETAEHYRRYYLSCWDTFKKEFRDDESMRKAIKDAYSLLSTVYHHVKKLE
ncbi:MAG: hypothetical protein ACLFVP_06510 [Candidatus Bathyarchaeia archaeon]